MNGSKQFFQLLAKGLAPHLNEEFLSLYLKERQVDSTPPVTSNINRPSTKNLRLLTFREAARRIGVSAPTFYSYIKKGYIPKYMLGDKTFVKEEDLEKSIKLESKKSKDLSIQDVEKELRSAIRRGKRFDALLKEFQAANRNNTISSLASWLFEERKFEYLKGAINIDLKELENNNE